MLTITIPRIVTTLAIVATVGLSSAATAPTADAPNRTLTSQVVTQETWPAPDAALKSGTLSFTGHSTVGDFVGTTTTVTGGVVGSAELTNARGWVEAPVATLSTGNRLRDHDLRATMDVDKYPTMRFELAGVTIASGATADTVIGALHGALTIHGVTHDIVVPATLIAGGDTVGVTGAFPIDLGDYRIGGLTRLFGTLRVRRNIEVRFHARFEAAAAAGAVGAAP